MADQIQFFCSPFLRLNCCPRGVACIFSHIAKEQVVLLSQPTESAEFVLGRMLYNVPAGRRIANLKSLQTRLGSCLTLQTYNSLFQLPCLYITSGVPCPYSSGCLYKHINHSIPIESNTGNNMPSTSSQISASVLKSPKNCSLAVPCPETTAAAEGHAKRKLKNLPYTITSGALKKEDSSCSSTSSKSKEKSKNRINTDEWVNAPEFVPRIQQQKQEQQIQQSQSPPKINNTDSDKSKKRLCPYAERDGLCKYPSGECTYLHGDVCDLCTRPALHPHNEDQRRRHTADCIRQHERDMELSFAVARSKEMVCGICFETILQKATSEQRFGILSNCNHCFCLVCIRKWRQSKQFENKIIRACPECRVTSDFVCPSAFWVDTKEEKDRVITNYKTVLSKKDCKYFKAGRGSCPFGNKCFYRHVLEDGSACDVGPPPSVHTHTASRAAVNLLNQLHADVEHLQRLFMLDLENCPLDLPDDMDIDDIFSVMDISDVYSDSDDSHYSDLDLYMLDY